MNDLSEKINLDDLYNSKRYREEKRHEVYVKVLNRVHKKIKTCSRQKNNEEFCFYVVPEFIIGFPRYDIATCTSFLIDKLLDNGFQVKYTHPNLLFISWKHYIPAHERQEIKKKYGVSVDGFGNVKKKTKEIKNKPENPNDYLYKPKNQKITVDKKKADKNYKSVSSYKPTGLIYNNDLFKTIRDNTTKET